MQPDPTDISQFSQSDIAPAGVCMAHPQFNINTASQFLLSLRVDQLYPNKVYFGSFVIKPNQACIKYAPKCMQ